jgi:CubicO group peptidase (beta-lactamase class C family)
MIDLNRRRLLAGIAAGLAAPPALGQSAASAANERLSRALLGGRLNGLHTLLASRGGKLLLEYYGRGEDEIWGRPIGVIGFGPDVLHDVRSVSKSIVALVYGIALAAGKVPRPEAKLYEQFPDYRDLASPERDRLTVHHALEHDARLAMGRAHDQL